MPTTTQIALVVADTSQKFLAAYPLHDQFVLYLRGINLPDLLATCLIGVVTALAREVYHTCMKKDQDPCWKRTLFSPLVGIVGAIMGGEIANLAGHEESSWLFVVAIAWIGGSALDRFANLTLGLVDKALNAIGVREEQQQKHIQQMDKVEQDAELKALQDSLNQPL